MASFIIHYITADNFLKKIKATSQERMDFLLTNLVVDTVPLNQETTQSYKQKTHFREDVDLDKCIQLPNLDKFTKKYHQLLLTHNMIALGYLYHLYVDKYFFEKLFTISFKTLDNNQHQTNCIDKVKCVLVTKNNNLYNAKEFFDKKTSTGLYNDYTVMNSLLLEKYNIDFNESTLINYLPNYHNPGIEEVSFSSIKDIIKDTYTYIKESKKLSNKSLNVFKEEEIYNFIEEVTSHFIKEYNIYLKEN